MSWRVLHGDCLDLLCGMTVVHAEPYRHVEYLGFTDNSVDAIACDPPYGLKFMGRDWDYAVPGPEYWRELLRVTKPGGHLVAFGGTRTSHRLTCAIEDAGWEIRDSIGNLTTLLWMQGQGFAKGHRVDVAIDKHFGVIKAIGKAVRVTTGVPDEQANLEKPQSAEEYDPITDEAKKWKGWNVQLKPGFEPIVLARKPLKGTVAENILKWGTGAMNIDGCRIASGKDHADKCASVVGLDSNRSAATYGEWKGKRQDSHSPLGRWPPNMALTHHPDCKVIGTRKDNYKINRFKDGAKPFGHGAGHEYGTKHCKDIAIEVYECHPECPVRLLDEQSEGKIHGAGIRRHGQRDTSGSGKGLFPLHGTGGNRFGDTGTASRFFYTAKAAKHEKNKGVDGAGNTHVTVKPLELCQWLVRLITPPGGVVLDSFCGSGSILIAAKLEGFDAIGIDKEWEAVNIARKRLLYHGTDAGETIEAPPAAGDQLEMGLL